MSSEINSHALTSKMSLCLDNSEKIVVFDLDETLGCFVELGIFCDSLENVTQTKIQKSHFFEIIELYPEFIRPNIKKILSYLLKKKHANECKKIMIYTNNQGPKSWTRNIADYFSHIIGEQIFDNIILAFKVHGKRVELNRTTHDKCVKDLVNCTKIPKNTKICFLDDQYHPDMEDNNVYYINIKPYVSNLSFFDMITRYYSKFPPKDIEKTAFFDKMGDTMKRYKFTVKMKDEKEHKLDRVISKQIQIYLEDFFRRYDKNKTSKNRKIKQNRTKRKITHE